MRPRWNHRGWSFALAISLLAATACGSADPATTPTSGPSDPPAEPTRRILVGRALEPDVVGHFQMAADGSGETWFGPDRDFEVRQLSPDGSSLAVVAMSDAGVLVGGTVAVDGTGFELFDAQDRSLHLACGVWASNGRMACEGWDDSDPARSGIYTVRASDGTALRRLTESRDVPCDYSPDGTQLAFVRTGDDDAVGTLMVMDADGGTPHFLAPNIALSGIACDWSPDGQTIVAGSTDGALLMVSPEGEGTPLSGDGIDGYAWGAAWSPDGARLLFSMVPAGGDASAAFIAARDGSDLVRITDPGDYEEADAWLA
ncbi:MAG TPA: hypothetical protein VE032_05125 [Actinomycetota bacterium]|nr:hypothetical protein [Actinomycetota bacterium]